MQAELDFAREENRFETLQLESGPIKVPVGATLVALPSDPTMVVQIR